jgi:uncharacterized protein (UPF0332 family)
VNRLYYAAFYSFNAVLATDNRAYGKHSAVRSSIHRDYVKPGLLSSEVGLIYNRLFEWRQKADYEVMMRVDQAMAADLFSQTERLLNEMDRCLADA